MKNARILPLAVLTCIFVIFVIGLYFEKTKVHTPADIQHIPSETKAVHNTLININTATAAQLQTLPGIGSVLAGQIVAYREANGAFQSAGELMMLPGIGEKKLESIWDLITTGG